MKYDMDFVIVISRKIDIFIKKNLLLGQFWTGGNDIDVEGQWRWVTSGNPFTFTDWGPGEPNDTGGNEDCMLLLSNTGYTWNDLPCSTNSLYICEKP